MFPTRHRRHRHRSALQARHLVFDILEDRTLLSFGAPVDYASGLNTWTVAKGDFRGGGVPDLAVPNFLPVGTVSILLGNGDGTFGIAQSYLTGENGPTQVVTGDFNGDGNLDLAVLDFNNAQGHVSILLGNGDGTFQTPIVSPLIQGANAIAVGDFNGDASLDVASANSDSTATVLFGNGDGTLQAAVVVGNGGTNPDAIAAGDVNSDGTPDLVVANYFSGTVSVLTGNGDGSFRPAVNYEVHRLPLDIALADLRGLGTLDIVTANQTDNVSVLLNNGDGSFQSSVDYSAGAFPAGSLAIDDFRGNGTLDIATSIFGDGTVSLLLGNGDGTFQAPISYAASTGIRSVVAGDFNGDGLPDLATANDGPDTVSILLNQGDWSPRPVPRPGPGKSAVPSSTSSTRADSISTRQSISSRLMPFANDSDESFDPSNGAIAQLALSDYSGNRFWLLQSVEAKTDPLLPNF